MALAAPQGTVRLGGISYVDLSHFATRFGLKVEKASANGANFRVFSKWTDLRFEVGSRECAINGLRVFLGDGIRSYQARPYISQLDIDKLLVPILRPGLGQPRPGSLRTIMLDPGHGGKDSGMVNKALKLQEKILALDTAQRLKKLLEADGYKVVLTRTSDRYVDLPDRPALAKNAGADLFVSLHYNSVASGAERVTGIEVFTMTPQFQYSTSDPARRDTSARAANPGNRSDHWNALLAYHLHRALQTKLPTEDRGMKRARFAVLRLVTCPAILVEGGYLSNPGEARKIATPAYRQKLAEAVADGIRTYDIALSAARK